MSRETMTSRQRVVKAFNHETPDRVPIDLGGNQTGIHKFAYQALLDHLGIRDELTIMDAVQQLARPCEALLQRFHVDTRYIAAGAAARLEGGNRPQTSRDGRLWHDLTDEFGVTWSMPDDQPYYMDISHHPLANATMETSATIPFPQGDDPGRFAGLRQRRAANSRRDALCGRQRHFRRGLRDLLVPARAGAMVHRHAHPARVLRGAVGPDAEILAGLVPRCSSTRWATWWT